MNNLLYLRLFGMECKLGCIYAKALGACEQEEVPLGVVDGS